MCGLFGFVSTGGAVDVDHLKTLAEFAARRGPHAWGVAWADPDGMECHVEARPYRESQWWPGDGLKLARAVIGHCRMATSGSYDDPKNAHPLPVPGGFLAHNGTYPGAGEMQALRAYELTTAVDSEVLGHVIADGADRVSLAQRFERAVMALGATAELRAERPQAVMGLWPGQLAVVRWGHPLYFEQMAEGIYFCSWRSSPAAKPVPEAHSFVWDFK